MTSPILITKLFIPAARPELVQRPRLMKQLDEGLHRKLTLISAPAGFGKTTLVVEWLNHLQGGGQQGEVTKPGIAWLSLDREDNDPTRFLTYLTAAINQIDGLEALGEEVFNLLQSTQPKSLDAALILLINEISATPARIVFVLDDCHLIDAKIIHDALAFLLENLPSQMHLVITTREDPPLPLSRLRVRAQMTELRAADLRFTNSEAVEFLNQVMGLNLSDEDIAALEARTEGWIAGLQLAALSVKGRDDATHFIQSFSGSNRLVLDYLIEEVLEQQPEEIQDFLLQTAILDRLSSSLCNLVTGQDHSQATLESLERANLFIVPLDHQRGWYRYHHLFAELLEQRLRLKYPDLINDLHAKAVIWHEANGFLSQAIQHAFAGGDIQNAVRLTEKGALDALEQSDFGFILKVVERLPETMLESSPWLFVYHGWALFLTGHIDIAAPKFEDTDWLLEALSDADEAQKQKMRGYIGGLKVQLTSWRREYEQINFYADQVKANLPAVHWIRAYCDMMLGVRCWDIGDLAAAVEVFTEALSIGKTIGNKRVAITGSIYLGHALELEGHLQQAAQVYQEALVLAKQDGRELPVACYAHIDFARVLYELNELQLSMEHLSKGIQQSQLLADDRIEKIGHGLLTRVYLALGNIENAENSVRQFKQIPHSPGIVYDMRGGEYPEVRLWLKQKKLKEIDVWLKTTRIKPDRPVAVKIRVTDTMYTRAMLALAQEYPDSVYLQDALELLNELLELADANGWGGKVIEINGLIALVQQGNGNIDQAMSHLERALTLAEPEGFIRIFVDEGPSMASLLYRALSQGIVPGYVQRLLAAFPDTEPEQAASSITQSPDGEWIEPLSEREIELLQLIAEGLSNSDIASQLYLSLNTVKAHTRSIYGKLGVNSRTQAVAKARTLGIISDQ